MAEKQTHSLEAIVDSVVASHEAEGVKLTKAATKAILADAFAAIERLTTNGDSVRIHNFGTFSLQHRAARQGRNPATGASITIEASSSIKFKQVKRSK